MSSPARVRVRVRVRRPSHSIQRVRCASHTREKKKKQAENDNQKGGGSGRFGTIRMDDSSGSASTRRVRCGAGDGASRRRRRRRHTDDADDADDADDRGSRRERGHRVFAASGRSVIHSVGEGAKRKTNRGKRETMVGCLERSAMETSRYLVRGRARRPYVVADETRDVVTIANECNPGYTPCNTSHNSRLFAHGYIHES